MNNERQITFSYRRAKQEWDDRMGDALVRAKAWRRMCGGILLVCVILSVGLIYYASTPKKIPYILEINEEGEAFYKGTLEENDFSLTEKHIRFYLKKFIEYTRTLSSDVVIVKKNWRNSYFFLTHAGAAILNTYARELNPLLRYKDYRIDIRFGSILEHSQYTRQVDWYESIWDNNGRLLSQTRWRGVFKYEFRNLITQEQLEKNPLGFFIDAFNWTEVKSE